MMKNKKLLYGVIILIILLIFSFVVWTRYKVDLQIGEKPDKVGCTPETKICPDGSAVGRNPNKNCEFDPCPPYVFDKSKFCPDTGDCQDFGFESRQCDNVGDCVVSCSYGCVSKKWTEGKVDCEAMWSNFECECIDGICQRSSYIACGCGCCVDIEPREKCLYRSKGDDLQKIIEEDKKAAQNPDCPMMGCSSPVKYIYCDLNQIPKEVVITTDKTEYEIGEPVKITITNNKDESIYISPYDAFPSGHSINRLKNGNWERISQICGGVVCRCRSDMLDCVAPVPPAPYFREFKSPGISEWQQTEVVYTDERCGDELYRKCAFGQVETGGYQIEFCYWDKKDIDLTEPVSYAPQDKKKCVQNEFTIKEKSIPLATENVFVNHLNYIGQKFRFQGCVEPHKCTMASSECNIGNLVACCDCIKKYDRCLIVDLQLVPKEKLREVRETNETKYYVEVVGTIISSSRMRPVAINASDLIILGDCK